MCLRLSYSQTLFSNYELRQSPPPTCCYGNPQIRWPLCVCLQECPGPALHPVPASATPFYDREAPAVPSPVPVDGLLPSSLAEVMVAQGGFEGRCRSGEAADGDH